jgi:hypothetical protein
MFLVIATVFHAVAALVTLFRIIRRLQTHKFWWDDGWAVLSALFNFGYMAGLWVPVQARGKSSHNVTALAQVKRAIRNARCTQSQQSNTLQCEQHSVHLPIMV